jgi:4-aminobutyrate aminotransferase-like enzyme
MSSISPGEQFTHCKLTGGRSATENAMMDAFKRRDGKMKALGFAGASHGQGLAMTQFAHPEMSLSMGWPVLNYPQGESDEQVLDNVRSALSNDVAVVVLEPVHWQSGRQMSSDLVNQIGRLAHEHEALLVVDETNTGCGATGRGFWATSEHEAVDYVTFGKRTQAAGYFSTHD